MNGIFLSRRTPFVAVFVVGLCAELVHAAPAEVRGTWLTTTGVDHIASGNETEAVFNDIRNIGLNTAYVETWKNGYTNYPSQVLANLTGSFDRNPTLPNALQRDLLEETLIQAHRNEMIYIGWFEYGFSAQFVGNGGQPSNPLSQYMESQGWLLQDQNGNYGNSVNGFAWMNPAVPEVRQFLIDITLEAVNRYDLDGIQFDDRLAWPKDFGWDATTAALYQAETGRSLPSNVNNSQFRAWRQSKVTQFAGELYAAVKAARPEMHVSVSPSITGFSDNEFNAVWTDWQNLGYFDEYVPQAYRSSIGAFNSIIDAQVNPFEPNDLDQLTVGIRINGNPPVTPYADLEDMIERIRLEGAEGHSLWFSDGVRELYPTQLTSFYDVAGQGHAQNPNFAADHRPAPIVATAGSPISSIWQVVIPPGQEGRYRIVAKQTNGQTVDDDIWTEIRTEEFEAGTYEFWIPFGTQVELLADRRSLPAFVGDFDSDGVTDAADLATLIASLGRDAGGDTNLDDDTDLADLFAWQRGRTGGSPPIATVPEPACALLLLIGCLLTTGRRR